MATPRDILVAPGVGNYVITCKTTNDAIIPGQVVTTVDMTADTNNVCWPDAADEATLGIVGCTISHDIDTAYTVGTMVPVYVRGSRAEVWLRLKAGVVAIKRGDQLISDAAAATGYVLKGTELQYEHIGFATQDCALAGGAARFCKAVLG